ncbi:MAG: response regulator [Bacteroidales bacterium]|nr:response regulator [Bacteroidales bacterium]
MKRILKLLTDKINAMDKSTSIEKLKFEMLQDIERLDQEIGIADFKISKSLKDKNILNSLLAKTSEDLKNALKQIKNQADELNILLDTIPAMVYFKDEHLRYRIANKAFLDFSGTNRNDIIGKPLKEVFKNYLPIGDYEKREDLVISQGKFFFNIEEQLEKNDEIIWVQTNIAPVRSDEGKIIGLIGVSWDITDQKNYEQALTRAKELAEQNEQIKDKFLTNMSHEIRTPLNGVMGMAELMEKTSLTKTQNEFLGMLKESGEHLVSIINDVFEYSSIEKGEISVMLKKFKLREITEEVIKQNVEKLNHKSLTTDIIIEENLPEIVVGDPKLIRRILENFVSNAIKFTKQGGVKLRISKNKLIRPGKILLRFEVQDTGIGIQEQHLNKLFESFIQLDLSASKVYQGTGLGLAIAKKLVNMMGGEIGVESEWTKGSIFWFTLPVEVPEEKERLSYDKNMVLNVLKDFRILLAEDNLINQKITKLTLQKEGCSVDVANNGQECFEKYQRNQYDLILMDIQMPIMDGLEATKKIREYEKEHKNRHTYIVALTANALKEDRDRALGCGMDGFIAKPFKPDELFHVLHQFIIRD